MTLEYFGVTASTSAQAPSYSPAVRAGDFIYVSGQVPNGPQGELVCGNIEAQTRQVMENLKATLALAGATLDDVCKCTCWLADARDFRAFNRVYTSYFPNGLPARSTTEARLVVDAKLEIEAIAYKPAA